MNFGEALEALKKGEAIARDGWNGKGMLLFLNMGNEPSDFAHSQLIEGINPVLFSAGAVGTSRRLPNINMRTATGSTVTGWLASQADMLAEDWTIFHVDNRSYVESSS